MRSPDHDPHDDEFDASQINVIEPMSDELWALFVQGRAPKGAAPPPGAGAGATAPASREPAKLAHIAIRAASGNVFKFRPATALMDKALLAAAIEAMIAEREAATRWTLTTVRNGYGTFIANRTATNTAAGTSRTSSRSGKRPTKG
jgi:hypothetical protein